MAALVGCVAAIAVTAPAHGASAEDVSEDGEAAKEIARLDREATVLFATIIKDLPEPPGSCEIEAEWSRYGVSYDIARKAVGLKVHASLGNPDGIGSVSDVVGPSVAAGTVCDVAARKRNEASHIEAWQRAFKALPAGAARLRLLYLGHTSFSFPLFDRDFQRAVLMRLGSGSTLRLDEEGERLSTRIAGGDGQALVYARDAAGWRKIDEIAVFDAD